MSYQVRSFGAGDETLMKKALEIREKVFVLEQQVSREEEYDGFDQVSHHYLVLDNSDAIGTARWRETDSGIKLERFAVLQGFRNRGAGEKVLQAVLQDTVSSGKKIYLHAQLTAVNFYKRAGFLEIGEVFYEANIPHYKMVYQHQK